MAEVEIEWPWQYSFPPFFTLQPHPETRAKQVAAWKHLILEYCRKVKLYTFDVREAHQLPLFNNTAINRKLDASVIVSILSEMSKTGSAAPLDKTKNRWDVYWHTLDEWGSIIYKYIGDTGKRNEVLTLFELGQGDDVHDQEWCGMNNEVLIKILKMLEDERKCELIFSDEETYEGVKFF